MYDLIGDIHGHAGALKKLLKRLGYQETDDGWQHAERRAIFVGDYIDRGPQIRETLKIVKNMTDAGFAIALLGNHEYNALAYNHRDEHGDYLREHNAKNYSQHKDTILQFEPYEKEWEQYLTWFKTLLLYFESEHLRVVHACWDVEHIQWLKNNGINAVDEQLLRASHRKGSPEHQVIEEVLKGKEVLIPQGAQFPDKDGNNRNQARLKWWANGVNDTYDNLIFDCPDELKSALSEKIHFREYPPNSPPVFFGHYWLKDGEPMILRPNVVCLDYSIANGGYLAAYRFNFGETLSNSNFVWVGIDLNLLEN
jgi:hypothetical protein